MGVSVEQCSWQHLQALQTAAIWFPQSWHWLSAFSPAVRWGLASCAGTGERAGTFWAHSPSTPRRVSTTEPMTITMVTMRIMLAIQFRPSRRVPSVRETTLMLASLPLQLLALVLTARGVSTRSMIEEIEYDDVVQCDHSYDRRCHTTYVTNYESQQEED